MAKAAAIFVLVALMVAAGGASAAQCNAGTLVPCASPIITGSPPSGTCCSRLQAQRGCFCQFARDPAYSGYINSPTALKTLKACKVAVPKC